MKNFWQNYKNRVLIAAFALFAISFLINSLLGLPYFLNISGFFLALFVPGFAIKNILNPKENWLNNIIAAPIFTIFFFIPIYYTTTIMLHGKISLAIAIILITSFALISITPTHGKVDLQNPSQSFDKFLFFGIVAFLLVHLATTLAYRFVPEIDGYADIIKINSILSTGIFNVSYRPLFSFFASYLSLVSQVPPYWLFKFGIILIQFSGIYYLYQIIKMMGIKSFFAKYLILLSFVSVPVINLEIDYVRPNVIFLAALIPFIYFLADGLDGKKKSLIISSIISGVGMLFHEFFIILFIINFSFIFFHFWKKASNFLKFIIASCTFVSLMLLLVNIAKIPALQGALSSLDSLVSLLANGIAWKWWTLGSYSNMDEINLGWNGLSGTLKYYAYSMSPFLFFVFLFYLFVFIKKLKKNIIITNLEKVACSLLLIGLFFAEFLPRINFKTLPDRFWPLISMSLLILLVPTLSNFKIILERKIISIAALIIILIGVGGSVFIASAKSGYTSNKEYEAAIWVKNNTPKDAIFITQGGNGVMIGYFANRNAISGSSSFFHSSATNQSNAEQPVSEKIYQSTFGIFKKSLADPRDENLMSLNSAIKTYNSEFKKESLVKNIDNTEFITSDNKNVYVLYSKDKFNNYYAQRQWWLDSNFYGADLSKFNKGYDLVYNDNDIIFIWKKR